MVAALDEHLGVRDHALAVAKAEDHEIPCLIDRENGAAESLAHLDFLASLLLALELGDLRGEAGVLVGELVVDRLEFLNLGLEGGHVRRGRRRGGGGRGLLLELRDAGVLGFRIRLGLGQLGLQRGGLLLGRGEFLLDLCRLGLRLAEVGGERVFLAAEGGDLGLLLLDCLVGGVEGGLLLRRLGLCGFDVGALLEEFAAVEEAHGGGSD